MVVGAFSTLSDEPYPGEEATSVRGLTMVLCSMGPQGKGSRRSISPSQSEVKDKSRDQRERPRVEKRRPLGLGCDGASAKPNEDI
jgi:hypothetical protein